MSFVISKIFWTLAQPSNLLLLALLVSAVTARIWPAPARRLLLTSAIALFLVTFLPIGQWLLLPMERRFSELRDMPDHVDGIVVLGGGVDVGPTMGRGYVELNEGAERLTVSADLARLHPEARLIYSGYKGRLVGAKGEAPDIAAFYVRAGVERDRITVEGDSRNTYENAIFSKRLAEPGADEVWLLVTSAYHMPRAVGVFRKLGWSVVPAPVDFRRPRDLDLRYYLSMIAQPHVSNRLSELDLAAKAWAGMFAYRLMGRTSALFPKP